MEEFKQKLYNFFKENGIELTNDQCQQFFVFYKELIETNEKFNLTAITDEDDVIVKHFFDSAVGYNLLKPNAKTIDIGAGAGFPSLPLKILRPDLEITLIDSVNKKINFLNEIIKKLNLTKISAIHTRAEDLAFKSEYREKFDYCLSRAVAKLNTLCEYCLPFVKLNGTMLAYKSQETQEEIDTSLNAINLLGGKIKNVFNYKIKDYDRKIIEIEKFKVTPKKYPRMGNKPRTQPL